MGDRLNESDALSKIGDIHHATGDLEAAHAAWTQAAHILDQLHHPDADHLHAELGVLDEHIH